MKSAEFRILVSDDRDEGRSAAQQQIGALENVELHVAESPRAAIALIDEFVFHLAFVDLEQEGTPAGGRRVLQYLLEKAPSCRRLVMTRFSQKYSGDLVGLAAPDTEPMSPLIPWLPRIHGIIDKGRAVESFFEHYSVPAIKAWKAQSFAFEGRDAIEEKIQKKRKRIPNLRAGQQAITDEIEILMRAVFGGRIGVAGQDRVPRISATPFTGGFSSSVTFSAEPEMGQGANGQPILGNTCIIKVGPISEIREEASRYDQVVRFGVALDHRVEMLSVAFADSLAAICYSPAGGATAKPESLDEMLDQRNTDGVKAVFKDLFDTETKSWYATVTQPTSLTAYFRTEYGFDLNKGIAEIHNWARKRAKSRPSTGPSVSTDGETLTIGNVELALPAPDLAGHEGFLQRSPSCLIHGDLHGGNVMINRNQACLIDFRQAGSGPRMVDFASLHCTVRMHEYSDQEGTGDIEAAARQTYRDALVIRHAMGKLPRQHQVQNDEEALAMELNNWARVNFGDSRDPTEYLLTNAITAIRVASLATIGEFTKIRLIAWISALLKDID